MAAIKAGDVVLNSRYIERFEKSCVKLPDGRIREDAAGNRTWQITAHLPDGRFYVIYSGLSEADAQKRLNGLAILLNHAE